MKKLFFILIPVLLCFSVFLTVGRANAQTSYYVDGTSGNDSYSGTSLSQAWKTIQYSFDNATPGSTVYILGGTYHENISVDVSGISGHPITYRNYQHDTVILDGTGTAGPNMLYLEDQSNITIENITIRNMVDSFATGVTISCTNSGFVSNIILRNLKITGIDWSSDSSAVPNSSDNSNPLLVSGGGTAQANAITNVIIDSCEIFQNYTGFSEGLSLDGNIDTFIVSHNYVHNNTNIGIDMEGNYGTCSDPTYDHARNGHCFLNTCHNDVSNYATSGGIYVDGGENIIIERNTSFQNGYGIEIGCEENGSTSNIIVRDNVFYNNQTAGIAIGGYNSATTGQVLNSSVLNNTFLKDDYSNSGTGEIYMTKMSGCKIRNNIFYTNSQNILITRDNIAPFNNDTIDYNCWYTPNNDSNSINITWGASTFTSFSNYKVQTGMESHSKYADPQLNNESVSSPNFHLLSASPCINAGNPVFAPGTGETDYYGDTRVINSRVDMGANEFSSSTSISDNPDKDDYIYVYPNPASKNITIKMQQQSAIKIFNIQGQLLKTLPLSREASEAGTPSGNKTNVDVSALPCGVYVVEVKTEKGVEVKKFVKE
ncbi:MAG: T9SS type A sorting domain-containing protein [Bacteroidales bacterium]